MGFSVRVAPGGVVCKARQSKGDTGAGLLGTVTIPMNRTSPRGCPQLPYSWGVRLSHLVVSPGALSAALRHPSFPSEKLAQAE